MCKTRRTITSQVQVVTNLIKVKTSEQSVRALVEFEVNLVLIDTVEQVSNEERSKDTSFINIVFAPIFCHQLL